MTLERFVVCGACLWWMAAVAAAQAPDVSKIEFRAERLAPNLHALYGSGGNLAVLTGPDGPLLIDSELVELTPKLRGAVALLADTPVRFVVNTHFHFDHAGGNAPLGRGGAVILAHDNVRRHLTGKQVIDVGVKIETEPTAREGLPVVTFADGLTLHVNDEKVTVKHVAHAHTDSDAFVFFEKANVLHTGDLFMSLGYPFVDGPNGGSTAGLIAAFDQALALCNEQTRVIPGHGALATTAELRTYRDLVFTVRQRVQALVRKGRTQEQVVAAGLTREYDERWGKGFVNPQIFVQRMYVEAMRERKGRGGGAGP
jgi:cyclase